MTAATVERPMCSDCGKGSHCNGELRVPTGRRLPDRDPYRDRDRLIPEYVRCGCTCGGAE